MGNATLWEISNEMQKMDLWLDEIDEAEESEELKTEKEKMWLDVMVTLELMLKEKNVNIVRYILGLNKKTEIISDEIKRLQALKKQTETYRDWETDRKSTRLNSSHRSLSRMPSSA